MSTKEMAYKIIDRMNEEQLKNFVASFGILIPDGNDEQTKRDEAFKRLESMRRHVNIDEKKELAEYREEKYGK